MRTTAKTVKIEVFEALLAKLSDRDLATIRDAVRREIESRPRVYIKEEK